MTSSPSSQQVKQRLFREVARAIHGFDMIHDGDRILVALSGGKDSYALFHLLEELSRRAPTHFSLVPVHIDQGQPGHDPSPLVRYIKSRGFELHVEHEDTYSQVQAKTAPGKSYCSMCSRLRRAILYRLSDELHCTKIALGHHRDDAIVTLLLNLVFSGQLKAMPPKLVSDDGNHLVIRPLIYCAEDVILQLSKECEFPILPCLLCGSQPNQQRKAIDGLLADLESRNPGVRASMLAALANVRPSHLLDHSLWNALGLKVASDVDGTPDSVVSADRLVRM
ncbi:MAG: tRNA 2-thiocytidine(32) synthetase TtcA [Polyangiaceae bacterium]|nr:tRNA 2-thiocytidine(32) synthetase TtcA [Polyangiaceae bacterium]